MKRLLFCLVLLSSYGWSQKKPYAQLGCTPASNSMAADPGVTVVLKSTSPTGPFATLTSTAPANCSYQDSAITPGVTYYYEFESVIDGVTGIPSLVMKVPVIVNPTMAISVSPSSITPATSVLVKVVLSGTPTPTGSVVVSGGKFASASTTLVAGSATITVPGSSLSSLGSVALTATYTPDTASATVYNPGSASSTVSVAPSAPTGLTFTIVQ